MADPRRRRRSSIYDPRPSDHVTLDEMLIYLGEFGTYQRALFVVLLPFSIFLVFVYFTQMFITVVPLEHWCKLPSVEGVTPERLKELMIPSSDRVPYEGHQLPYSRCWVYDLPIEDITKAERPDERWPMKKCNDWHFEFTKTDIPYATVATEQGWVCDAAYMVTVAQSIFFVGAICGGFIFGELSDKYGRIPALMGTNIMALVGSFSTIYVSNFWQFCICRFIVGFAFDNTFVIAYILVLEYVGPKWRTFAANMSYGIFYTGAAMILPWMAYYIADWKIFAMATSIPLVLVLFTPFVVPESIRWLISVGRIEKAVKIMMRVEKVNGRFVPEDVYEDFLDECIDTVETLAEEELSVIDLFKTKRLRKIFLLLTVSWSMISMTYDGHIRCVDTLGLDVFTTFTVAAATEFPAEVIITLTLDTCGRRWTLFVAVMLSGLASYGAATMPIGIYFAALAMFARLCINIAANISLQYAAELLPTVVRGKGVAFIHIMGYVTQILSPFVAFSSRIKYNFPMIILGTTCMIAALLGLFLPETLKEHLPQTMLDGEMFGIYQSFWETPFTRHRDSADTRVSRHTHHAKRPAAHGGLLRSSMVSGDLGNRLRLEAVREKVGRSRFSSRRSISAKASTPLEYVQMLRHSYAEARKQLEEWERDVARQRTLTEQQEEPEESHVKPKRERKTKFVDEQDDEDDET